MIVQKTVYVTGRLLAPGSLVTQLINDMT